MKPVYHGGRRPGPPRSHVYIPWQKIVFSGGSHGGESFLARSTDGGDSFADPSTLSGSADESPGINGSLQGMLMEKIAANASGHVAVVNSRFNRGVSSRIRLYRGHMNGANE